jgi:hypothetical protein
MLRMSCLRFACILFVDNEKFNYYCTNKLIRALKTIRMKNFYLLIISLLLVQPMHAQVFWEEVSTPLTTIYAFHCINETDMIIGGYNDGGRGFFVSDNGGVTWEHVISNNHGYNYIGHHNETILAFQGSHLFKMNGLYDWEEIADTWMGGTLFLINDTTIIMGNWETVKKSIDGGYTWRVVHNTGPNERVENIIQHPNGDLFFGTYTSDETAISGAYKSSDLGETWERAGLKYHNVMSVAVNSQGVLYAGTYGQWGGSYTGGIFKSDDLGVTWTELKSTLMLRSIVITPGDTIYAGCDSDHATQGGVFRSTDNGETWELINQGFFFPNVMQVMLGGDGHLYSVTKSSPYRLYRSVSKVTGISEKSNASSDDLKIYPNPATNYITIGDESGALPVHLAIYNLHGQLVYTVEHPSSNRLSIKHLPSGMYFISVKTPQYTVTKKFLKN